MDAQPGLAPRQRDVRGARVVVPRERADDDERIAATLALVRRRRPAVIEMRIRFRIKPDHASAVELDVDRCLRDGAHRAGVAVEDADPGLGVLLEHPVSGRELVDTAREPEGNSGAYMRAARLLRAVQR